MMKRSRRAFHYALLCSAAITACATSARAQPAPTAAPAADTDTGKVEKVTVTAQKRKQNAQDVPETVNAINGKNIKDLGITSSDRIAQYVPGVSINLPSGQGNQPIVSIRGVGNNDFNTNNTGPNGIYSDEVYLSAPSSQTFLTFDLDRIEVLKGPQGTLYGRNTSGGAVNFISNKPVLGDFGAGANLSYGSFNSVQAGGFVNLETGDNSAARIAASWDSSDGYMRNLLNGDRVSGTEGYAVRGQWLVKPIEQLDLLFNLHGSKIDTLPQEYHHVGALDPSTFAPCTKAEIGTGTCVDFFGYDGPTDKFKGNYNRTEHLKNDSKGGSVRADYRMGAVTLTSISAIEHNKKMHPEDSDAAPFSLLEIDFGVDSDTFTQELRIAGETDKMHWLAGLYYLGETLNQDQSIFILHDADLNCDLLILATQDQVCSFTGVAHSKQKTNAFAAFAHADFEIAPQTRLTLGARYTTEKKDFKLAGFISGQISDPTNYTAPQALYGGPFVDSIDKSAFSWKASIDHHFTDKVMAYASFATGFKSGGFNGGFLNVTPSIFATQAAPVRPETNNAYEIGLKSDLLDDTLRLNVSGFYYDYKDLQLHTLVQSSGFPIDVLDNAQKATIKGIDVEAISKPVENLTLRVNAEWLKATLDQFSSNRGGNLLALSGNTLPNAPDFSLTGIAEYTIPVGNGDAIDLLAAASYRSKVYFDPANDELIAQDAYWVIDARAAYTLEGGRWQLAVFGRNLGDQAYLNMGFDLQSSFGLLQEVVAPPRTFGLEASFRY